MSNRTPRKELSAEERRRLCEEADARDDSERQKSEAAYRRDPPTMDKLVHAVVRILRLLEIDARTRIDAKYPEGHRLRPATVRLYRQTQDDLCENPLFGGTRNVIEIGLRATWPAIPPGDLDEAIAVALDRGLIRVERKRLKNSLGVPPELTNVYRVAGGVPAEASQPSREATAPVSAQPGPGKWRMSNELLPEWLKQYARAVDRLAEEPAIRQRLREADEQWAKKFPTDGDGVLFFPVLPKDMKEDVERLARLSAIHDACEVGEPIVPQIPDMTESDSTMSDAAHAAFVSWGIRYGVLVSRVAELTEADQPNVEELMDWARKNLRSEAEARTGDLAASAAMELPTASKDISGDVAITPTAEQIAKAVAEKLASHAAETKPAGTGNGTKEQTPAPDSTAAEHDQAIIDTLRLTISKIPNGRNAKSKVIIQEAHVHRQQGLSGLRKLQEMGEYDGFAKARALRYRR